MNFSIVKNKEHYDVYINDRFYCSADTVSEAVKEIEDIKNLELYEIKEIKDFLEKPVNGTRERSK